MANRFPKTNLLKKGILIICFIIIVSWIIVSVTIATKYNYDIWSGSYSAFNIFTLIAFICCGVAYGVYRVSPRAQGKVAAITELVPRKWKTLIDSGVTPYFNPEYYQIVNGRWQRSIDTKLDLDNVGLPIVASNVPLASFNVDIYKEYYRTWNKPFNDIKQLAKELLQHENPELIEYFYDTIREVLRIEVIGKTCWLVKPQYRNPILIHKNDYVPFIINDIKNNNNELLTDQINDEIMYEINQITGLEWLLSVLFNVDIPSNEKEYPNRHIYTSIYRELCAICKLNQTPTGQDLTEVALKSVAFKALYDFVTDPNNPLSFPYLYKRYKQAVLRISIIKNAIPMIKTVLDVNLKNSQIIPEMIYTRLTNGKDAILTFEKALNSIKDDPTFINVYNHLESMEKNYDTFAKHMDAPLKHVATPLSLRFASITQLLPYLSEYESIFEIAKKNNYITSQMITNATNNNLFTTLDKSKIMPEVLETATVASRNNLAVLNNKPKIGPIIVIDKSKPNTAILEWDKQLESIRKQQADPTVPDDKKQELENTKQIVLKKLNDLKEAVAARPIVQQFNTTRRGLLKRITLFDWLIAKVNPYTKGYAKIVNAQETAKDNYKDATNQQVEVTESIPPANKNVVTVNINNPSNQEQAEQAIEKMQDTAETIADEIDDNPEKDISIDQPIIAKPIENTSISLDLKHINLSAIENMKHEANSVDVEALATTNVSPVEEPPSRDSYIDETATKVDIKRVISKYTKTKTKFVQLARRINIVNDDYLKSVLQGFQKSFENGDKILHKLHKLLNVQGAGLEPELITIPESPTNLCEQLMVTISELKLAYDNLVINLIHIQNTQIVSKTSGVDNALINGELIELQNINPELQAEAIVSIGTKVLKEDQMCQIQALLEQSRIKHEQSILDVKMIHDNLTREKSAYEAEKTRLNALLDNFDSQIDSKLKAARMNEIDATAAMLVSMVEQQTNETELKDLQIEIDRLTKHRDDLQTKMNNITLNSMHIETRNKDLTESIDAKSKLLLQLSNLEQSHIKTIEQLEAAKQHKLAQVIQFESNQLNAEYQKRLIDLQTEITKSKTEVESLEAQNRQSEAAKTQLEKDIQYWREELERHQNEKNRNDTFANTQLNILKSNMYDRLEQMRQMFPGLVSIEQVANLPPVPPVVEAHALANNYNITANMMTNKSFTLENDIGQLRALIENQNMYLTKAKQIFETTSRQLTEANANNNAINEQITQLKEEHKEAIQELLNQIHAKEGEINENYNLHIEDLNSKITEIQAEKANISAELQSANVTIAELTKASTKASANIVTLRATLDENLTQLKTVTKEKKQLNDKIDSLNTTLAEVQGAAKKANEEKETIIEEQAAQLIINAKMHKAAIKKLQDVARRQEGTINHYKTKVQESKATVQKLTQEVDNLNTKIKDLTTSSTLDGKQAEELTRAVNEKQIAFEELQREKAALERAIELADQAKQELNTTIGELRSSNDKLNKEYSAYKSSADTTIGELRSSNEALETYKSSADTTIGELRSSNEALETYKSSADITIRELRSSNDKLTKEYEALKNNNKSYGELNTKNQTLRGEIITLKERIANHDEELGKRLATITLHEKSIEKLKQDLAAAKARASNQTEKVAKLEKDLADANRYIDELNTTIEGLKTQLDKQREEYDAKLLQQRSENITCNKLAIRSDLANHIYIHGVRIVDNTEYRVQFTLNKNMITGMLQLLQIVANANNDTNSLKTKVANLRITGSTDPYKELVRIVSELFPKQDAIAKSREASAAPKWPIMTLDGRILVLAYSIFNFMKQSPHFQQLFATLYKCGEGLDKNDTIALFSKSNILKLYATMESIFDESTNDLPLVSYINELYNGVPLQRDQNKFNQFERIINYLSSNGFEFTGDLELKGKEIVSSPRPVTAKLIQKQKSQTNLTQHRPLNRTPSRGSTSAVKLQSQDSQRGILQGTPRRAQPISRAPQKEISPEIVVDVQDIDNQTIIDTSAVNYQIPSDVDTVLPTAQRKHKIHIPDANLIEVRKPLKTHRENAPRSLTSYPMQDIKFEDD